MLSAAIWQVCVIRLEQVKPDTRVEIKMIGVIAAAVMIALKLVMITQLRSRGV